MSDVGYVGPFDMRANATRYEEAAWLINRILGRIATSTLVKVIAVYPGGHSMFSTVDVQPMVAQVDGQGNPTAHGTIYGLPVFRLQNAQSAIVLDPQVGDVGWAGFCSTDISGVVATQAPANPATFRRYSWSDGVYFGGVLGMGAAEYIELTGTGINIVTPTLTVTGTVVVSEDVTASGISLKTHVHTGVQTGGGTSGPPA